MKKLNVLNLASSLSTTFLAVGVLTIPFVKDNPDAVSGFSTLAFLGFGLDFLVNRLQTIKRNKLYISESTERSFLMQIRNNVARSKQTTDELLSVSYSATKEAESDYKDYFVFCRPAIATSSIRVDTQTDLPTQKS